MAERRSRRLRPLHDLADKAEREAARRLGEQLRILAEHESRLAELKRYQDSYAQVTPGASITPVSLFESRRFLESLAEAARQQERLVALSRDACRTLRGRWIGARRQRRVFENVVARLQNEERRVDEAREQKAEDESNLSRPRSW